MTVEEEIAGKTDAQLLEIIRDLSPYMSNRESELRDAALVERARRTANAGRPIVCNRSNNTKVSIARGELNVTVRYPPGGTAHQV